MSGPYIKEVRVQGFGCVEDATLKLTRLHALIGPNDSGKTTLLRAIRTALQFSGGGFSRNRVPGPLAPFDPGLKDSDAFFLEGSVVAPGSPDVYRYAIQRRQSDGTRETIAKEKQVLVNVERANWSQTSSAVGHSGLPVSPAFSFLRTTARWLHLDADAMREESKLFTENEPKVLDPSGSRLPAVYDAILNRGDDTFLRIAAEVRRFFPPIKSIRLRNVAHDTKAFEIELNGGQMVPASFLSDGVLYFLAFAALEHTEPASVLLIEEPENGLHPSRIADVMRVLRRLSERVQIVLATHSPFVINELQGDEVTVVTRPEGKGTQVRRLVDTPNFEERSKVYALGELWVSYADGKDERALLSPPDAAE